MSLDATRSVSHSTGATGLIVLAMTSFAIQDTTVKIVADEVSLWQIQFVRSLTTLALLVLLGRTLMRGIRLLPASWRWPLIRAAFMSGAYLCFYASLPLLTLSQAASAFYIGPLLITLFAALLLGERIGPRRIAAVVVGFVGVLFIIRPGGDDMEIAALLPIAAAACYAIGIVMTRWRCAGHSALSLTVTHNLLYTGIGAVGLVVAPLLPLGDATRAAYPFLATGWHSAGLLAMILVTATALTHVIGMMASVGAYRRAEASRIAPFEYVYLAIMPLIDLAVFGSLPRAETLVGMALITGSGAFVAWREGRPARPRIIARAEAPWTGGDEAGR